MGLKEENKARVLIEAEYCRDVYCGGELTLEGLWKGSVFKRNVNSVFCWQRKLVVVTLVNRDGDPRRISPDCLLGEVW